MIVIDASVWVSFFVQQDVNHTSTKTWVIKTLSARVPIAAPNLLLAEVGGAISRRLGSANIGNKVINQLFSVPTLHLVSIDHTLAIQASRIAAKHQLRGADAIYIAVAADLNIPLISWDREQNTRASSLVNTYTPQSAP